LPLLLQVPWFAELAATAAAHVKITADGELALVEIEQTPDTASQQLQLDAEQQAALSHLLATLLAKLSQQHQNVATQVLQRLVPQLLACQHAATTTSSTNPLNHGSTRGTSSWLLVLCRTAAQLHAARHTSAQQLATACVEQLESCTADARSTTYAASTVTLGQQACLQLLAAVLQRSSPASGQPSPGKANSTQKTGNSGPSAAAAAAVAAGHDEVGFGLQPELLQRLLQCVIPHLASGNWRGQAAAAAPVRTTASQLDWCTFELHGMHLYVSAAGPAAMLDMGLPPSLHIK
jgi:hypothetical protein